MAEVYCSFLLFSMSGGGGCGAKDENATSAKRTPRRQEQRSLCSPSPSPPFVHFQTNKRMHFLRLCTDFIDGSAEEIVCGVGPSGGHYNDAVRRMTNGLWEVARCELMQLAADDIEEESEESR